MAVRLEEVDVDVDRAPHERGQRQLADGLAILKVMIRALAVGAEVAGQIQRGVEIRNRAAGVIADQMAAAAFGLRVEHLRQIDDTQVAHLVYAVRHGDSSFGELLKSLIPCDFIIAKTRVLSIANRQELLIDKRGLWVYDGCVKKAFPI